MAKYSFYAQFGFQIKTKHDPHTDTYVARKRDNGFGTGEIFKDADLLILNVNKHGQVCTLDPKTMATKVELEAFYREHK